MSKIIELNGGNLTISDVWEVAYNQIKVEISPEVKSKIIASRQLVEEIGNNVVTYGVTTGFGPMSQYVMSTKQIDQLQVNLIRSHAVGFGKPLTEDESIVIMLVRLNTLLKGFSGVSWELVVRLKDYINHRIIPIIPRYGSVGASGDLVQLAHIGLSLIGEGKVYYQSEIRSTKYVLDVIGMKSIKLKSKEGLSLINGTSAMTAISALLCYQAIKQLKLAVALGAMSFELMRSYDDSISAELQAVRPHAGQIFIAKEMRKWLGSSQLIKKRDELRNNHKIDTDSEVKKIEDKVQDVYSIRCLPQIYGPIYDTLKNTIKVIEIEMNSTTDNPITDIENKTLIHGGNFHGDYISLEMDKLKIAMSRIALTIERQVNLFLNPNLRNNLPPFLNLSEPGLNLALQGIQFVATSTAAEIQSLCFPNYVHSISTNADNQDIVSMGTNTALITKQVIEGLDKVLSVGLITICQAIDVMSVQEKISEQSKNIYQQLREIFKEIREDRDLTDEIQNLDMFIRDKLEIKIDF